MSEDLAVEDSQPPAGLSGPALRAWKRRQRILQGGSSRLDVLTGSRDSVAEAATKEAQEEREKQNESTTNDPKETNPTPAHAQGKPDDGPQVEKREEELAAWEKKWNRAAENAPTVEVQFSPPPATATTTTTTTSSDGSGLRERKKHKEAQKESEENDAIDEEEMKKIAASTEALRLRLKEARWRKGEWWVRQVLIILLSLYCAWELWSNGGLFSPSEALYNLVDKEDESEEVIIDIDDFNQPQNLGGDVMRLVTNARSAPLNGWLSVPVLVLLLRLCIHLTVSLVAGMNFSMVDTVVASGKQEPQSWLGRIAAFIPALQQVSKTVALVQDVMEDVFLFAFVTVTFSACAKVYL